MLTNPAIARKMWTRKRAKIRMTKSTLTTNSLMMWMENWRSQCKDCQGRSICEHQHGANVRNVAAAASAIISAREASAKTAQAAASASTSECGADVRNVAAAASASTNECGASAEPVERSRTRQQKEKRERKSIRKGKGPRKMNPPKTVKTGGRLKQADTAKKSAGARHARCRHDFDRGTSKGDEIK